MSDDFAAIQEEDVPAHILGEYSTLLPEWGIGDASCRQCGAPAIKVKRKQLQPGEVQRETKFRCVNNHTWVRRIPENHRMPIKRNE